MRSPRRFPEIVILNAWYNDNDRHAAAWLRELVARGLIADGAVDARSIEEITPDEVAHYTQCHWFAGIGGWSYALRLAGWPDDEPVWTASLPCQPFSCAGRGRATEDPRHLWPQFRRLVAELRPPVIFGEQVASAAGREWLAGVRADLEDLGYRVGAADLCAASCGAPHIRQRLFWVAQSENGDRRRGECGTEKGTGSPGEWRGRSTGSGPTGGVGQSANFRHSGGTHHQRTGATSQPIGRIRDQFERSSPTGGVADGVEPGLEGHSGDGDDRDEPGRVAEASTRPAAASGEPCWVRCECCDDFLCNIHGDHVYDCPCPEIDWWAGEEMYPYITTVAEYERRTRGCFWSDSILVPCRDGKARRVGVRSAALADGLPAGMERSGQGGVAGIEGWPTPQVADHWNPSTRQSAEREFNKSNLRGVESIAGWPTPQALSFADSHQPGNNRGANKTLGMIDGADLSSLAIPILAHHEEGRVMLLRGYGNSIVPQLAAEFVRAYLESVTK